MGLHYKILFQIDDLLEGICSLENKPPTLIVVNKKDLIKPGEIAKRIEVCYLIFIIFWSIDCTFPHLPDVDLKIKWTLLLKKKGFGFCQLAGVAE